MKGKIYSYFQVMERSDLDCVAIRSKKMYLRTIAAAKVFIDVNMKNIYGRKIFFKECNTTDIKIQLKELISVCNNTKNISIAISNYLGCQVSLFREENGKRIPCEIDRIKKAYLAVQSDLGEEEINNILYN